ncbi:short-chain dehydrogenase [Tersicoccus solisilvae]|uniref:Short-chain dehydrogenase n=1 Tax=Tersicoccus solisilvae TaxID=1882339 RepID=A0ABQ1P272_9MICC|nr:SDR family oxidoreductase [Tersicoccus solisilvae]GGC85322.1 short-chain dehydrogenase [Tersicoccus solisilvae]
MNAPRGTGRLTAVVTGVGRSTNIGAAICRRLAAGGWDLVLPVWTAYEQRMPWGSVPGDVDALAAELRAAGARVTVLEADLADPAVPDRVVDRARAAHGDIAALVLSHAESVDSAIADTTVESFDRHLAVNARAPWQLIRAFAAQFPSALAGRGRIVALTSDHVAFNLPYGASKGALDRIVIAAAKELGPQGISANVVNPGPVDTGWMDDAVRSAVARQQPTGRLGTPDDVARLVDFLLSADGGWVNGQLLHSDGGFSISL